MDKMKLNTKFEVVESNYLNPQFLRAKCLISYYGNNRNMSCISKEAFASALPSLFNIPIVGEWIKENNDFGDHGGMLEETDEGYKWVSTTVPFGVVPMDAEPHWEMITEETGFQREYLVCDVILWKRYPEVMKILENKSNQSMEIEVVNGYMKNKYYFVEEFVFSALCVLGSDVTPCFESSSIRFNLDKETFKSEFKLMLEELKQFRLDNSNNINNTNSQEGGSSLVEENKIENIEQIETPVEEFTEEETVVVVETTPVEVQEETPEEVIEPQAESVVEPIVEETPIEQPTEEKVEEVVEPIEEPITEEVEKEFNVLETEEYKALEEKFSALEQQFNVLTEEVESLRTFKANKELEGLKADVDTITSKFELEESEISELKVKAYNKEISLETYEEKLFALVGKKNFSKIEQPEEKQSLKFSLKETEKCPYSGLEHLFNK